MSSTTPYTLRSHRPGDIGWIIHRQGILYYEEYGWDEHFEALVAEICARFIQNENPECERCWVAERNGEIVGAVFCIARPNRSYQYCDENSNAPRRRRIENAQMSVHREEYRRQSCDAPVQSAFLDSPLKQP